MWEDWTPEEPEPEEGGEEGTSAGAAAGANGAANGGAGGQAMTVVVSEVAAADEIFMQVGV